MIIDAHHHFWAIGNPWCNWPTPDLEAIHRDFGADELRPLLKENCVTHTVLVQAAPDADETRQLLRIADSVRYIAGVIGWVDLEHPNEAKRQIIEFCANPCFKGVRPMLQDLGDRNWILRSEYRPILDHISRRNLTFDALIRADQLAAINQLAGEHPNLSIVIDHAAKPSIAENAFRSWADDLAKCGQRANVFCKLSGLVTEARGTDNTSDFLPYINHILDCFGPGRVMWGSDWPVLNLASTYEDWLAICQRSLSYLGADDQAAVFGATAAQFYLLDTGYTDV